MRNGLTAYATGTLRTEGEAIVQQPRGAGHGDGLVGPTRVPTQNSHPSMHTISVDPRRSMKAATEELELALDRLGADLSPSSRRATALLATELVAQVVGRELGHRTRPVDLRVALQPGCVRLEAGGAALRLVGPDAEPRSEGPALAEWGHFLLDRLADRWGIDGGDPPTLWAEVSRG